MLNFANTFVAGAPPLPVPSFGDADAPNFAKRFGVLLAAVRTSRGANDGGDGVFFSVAIDGDGDDDDAAD